MEQRVVVTGMGVVTPIGTGLETFRDSLMAGRNGIGRVTHFDPSEYRSQMAAEVRDFDPLNWIDKKMVDRLDRFNYFSLAAAAMAVEDAGLPTSNIDCYRIGVIIGSGIGGADTIQDGYRHLHEKGPKAVSPFFISKVIINMSASLVSIRFGFKGPLAAPSVACSTGGNAIGEAFRMLQRGDVDVMLAGSAEAAISPLPYAGFCATRSMSTRNDCVEKASRPFDKHRDGFVMGEGGGIVVLERLEHALKRDAKIYAELIGYGNTADAFHFTAPHPEGEGMIRVMKNAFEDARIQPEEVDYINAHGTSTLLNDKAESLAIQKVFGEHAAKVKISSNKSMIGHLLAGAGSVEFIATVLSIGSRMIPPTINYEEPDPDCPLDYVIKGAEALDINIAISNNFGFGGGNACLVLRRYEQ